MPLDSSLTAGGSVGRSLTFQFPTGGPPSVVVVGAALVVAVMVTAIFFPSSVHLCLGWGQSPAGEASSAPSSSFSPFTSVGQFQAGLLPKST